VSLRSRVIEVSCTGAAGAASGSASISLPPVKLRGLNLAWAATQGAPTADVTITNRGRTVLSLTNSTTTALYAVRENVVKSDGSAASAGDNRWDKFVLSGVVTVNVAQADPDPTPGTPMLVATLFYDA
jgi:hypothetical protein